MANKALKFCAHAGCNELTTEKYCEKHKVEHEQIERDKNTRYEKSRGSASSQGYDRNWRRVRLSYLKRNPLCEVCESKGIITPAILVHHIKPVKDYPELRLDKKNLMSLCNRCHENIHGKDRFKRR